MVYLICTAHNRISYDNGSTWHMVTQKQVDKMIENNENQKFMHTACDKCVDIDENLLKPKHLWDN